MNILRISVGLAARSYAVNADEFYVQNAECDIPSTVRSVLIIRQGQSQMNKIMRQKVYSFMDQEWPTN